ncbi:MAG: macro domain-containing protein [candidate division WOR-3 bacterium]
MTPEILKEKEINKRKVYVFHGDITELEVDAIVNAANEYLKHGGGLAGVIVKKGGKIIQEESNKIGYCPVGSAVVTSAGKLKAKYVIHAVGPKWGEGDEEKKLKSAVRSALKLGEDKKIKSIAFPAISTGIFGFPKEKGTKIIVEEVKDFLIRDVDSIKEVYLCDINLETCKYFEEFL